MFRVVIKVDDSKLTPEQQKIAEKWDGGDELEHPATAGYDSLRDTIENFIKTAGNKYQFFSYLRDGIDAVEIEVEED